MIVSCGLNIGKLLKVLNEGLLKEETRLAPLLCLVGNEDSDGISLLNRDKSTMFMLNLSRHCGFHSETYSLSVNLLDRFLSVVKANPKYLHCISICCLFLAVKMCEENEQMLAESGCSTGEIPDVPTATDLVKVSGLRFSSSDLLRMERIILDKLEWNLSVNASTPLYFLQVFHALCVSKGFLDHCPVSQHLQHITASLEDLLCYHKFMFFKPSTLSLALLSCELVYVSSNWLLAMHYLQQEAKIPDAELWQCSKLLNEHFNSISNNHLSRFKTLSITDREDQPFTVIEN